jgi:large subunit ribosomal protein L18
MLKTKREARHKRVRKTITGTSGRPRLAVFRSTQHIYAQIVDDSKGVTLVAASDLKVASKATKREKAMSVGEEIAAKAIKEKIKKVVFDRGGFRFHGRVASLAQGARKGGLEF